MRVYTSLPPVMARSIGSEDWGMALREACLQAWTGAGFDVTSVNSQDESDALLKQQPQARIHAHHDGAARAKISDIAKLALDDGVDFAIIANADCLLSDPYRLRQCCERLGTGELGLLERKNISPSSLRPTGKHCAGFDVFIAGPVVLRSISTTDDWRIGDTWWDYWLPVRALLNGAKIRGLSRPAFLHLDHPTRWDWDSWRANGERFASEFLVHPNSADHPQFHVALSRVEQDGASKARLLELGDLTFAWLRSLIEKVDYAPPGSADDIRQRLLDASHRRAQLSALFSSKQD